jgi:hypothetical protein
VRRARRIGAARGELVSGDRREGPADRGGLGERRFDAQRLREAERPVGGVEFVTRHVADGAGAEIVIAAPVERQVSGIELAHGRDTEPEIPVERRRYDGHELGVIGGVDALWPDGAVGPAVHLTHLAEHAGVVPLLEQARALAGVALVAHLRRELFLAGDARHLARLPHGVRDRFFDEHVLAVRHRGHRDGEVHVIGDGDGYRVDLAVHFVEHHAEILKPRDGRVGLERPRAARLVDIAECDEVFRGGVGGDVRGAAPAAADDGDVELVVRRIALGARDERKRERRGRRERRALEERAAGERRLRRGLGHGERGSAVSFESRER